MKSGNKENQFLNGKHVWTFRESNFSCLKRNHGIWKAYICDKVLKFLGLEQYYNLKYCQVTEVIEHDNIIPNVGKNALATQFANEQTYDVGITYVAVGTGAGAVGAGDTTLFTELARVANSVDTATANVCLIQGFFNSATGNGILTNAGFFGDGASTQATASADTGILYSHVNITRTKTTNETLTVQLTLSVV